jgi:uncharacterized repeat protein (TIGR01451 family)
MNTRLIAIRLLGAALLWVAIWLLPATATARFDRSVRLEAASFRFSVTDHIAPDGSVYPGSTIAYTLLLTNTGDLPLANIEIAVLAPAYTTVPAPGDQWECEAAPANPDQTVCRTAIAMLAAGDHQAIDFALEVTEDLPPTQDTVLLQATATADGVVCGDCGYAWCETPIIQGSGDPEHYVLLPLISAPRQP